MLGIVAEVHFCHFHVVLGLSNPILLTLLIVIFHLISPVLCRILIFRNMTYINRIMRQIYRLILTPFRVLLEGLSTGVLTSPLRRDEQTVLVQRVIMNVH